MEKIIATLPCSDAAAQVEFYKNLGFELLGKYPRSYFVLKYKELEFHFYGTKMFQPQENPSMCIIETDNLEDFYNAITTGLKEKIGKIPRSGFPKITKIRELSEDWRFTLADPSGNTIYVIQRKPDGSGTFFRDIDNEQYAKKFAILYDVVYSKQDMEIADKVFSKLSAGKELFSDLDKAKLILMELEIYKDLDMSDVKSELEMLIMKNGSSAGWKRISERLSEMQ